MKAIFEWTPIILLASFALALSGVTYLLYRRWRTRNYFYLYTTAAAVSITQLLLFAAAAAGDAESLLLRTIELIISCVLFAASQATIFHYFLPDKRKGLAIHGGFVLLTLIGAGGFFYDDAIGAGIVLLAAILFLGASFFTLIPKLPKRKMFRTSYVLFVISILLQAVPYQFPTIPGLFFAGLLFLAGAYFVLLMIFDSRLVDMVEAVAYSAATDGLTGVYNKAHFLNKLQSFLRTRSAYGLIFSDIDNFKKLNDTQGHEKGDDILKLVAHTMRDVCGDLAMVCRYGGEEMVAIVTSKKADSGSLAEAFRARVEQVTPSIYPVTVSVGYTLYTEGVDPKEFIRQADEAMYKAKHSGKNRVCVYQPESEEELA